MILSCLLFLLGLLPGPDLMRSLLVGGLWLLLLWALFRTVRRGCKSKKHKFLGGCLALFLVIDMAGLLPYLDPRERSVLTGPWRSGAPADPALFHKKSHPMFRRMGFLHL